MAGPKGSAIDAFERAQEEQRQHEGKVRDARKAAFLELGELVMSTGSARISPSQLKAILQAVTKLGAEKALALLDGSPSSTRGPSSERGSGKSNNANGAESHQSDGHA